MAGLFSKYQVRDQNGNALDSGTFVLRPFNADGSVRDFPAWVALREYARCCELEHPDLAKEINDWTKNGATHPATKTLNIPLPS